MSKTILIIDDDIYIGDMIEEVLTKESYHVLRAYSGTEALLLLKNKQPDLALLDLMLPGLSGEELLPKLTGIPVIVMSAKADLQSKLDLLISGACDYITKPFEIKELLVRIQVQLRTKLTVSGQKLLCFEALTLNTQTREVLEKDTMIHLTKTEYNILRLLMENPKQVLTKSILLDRISIDSEDCTESSLKVHISNLRRKLRDISGHDYIEAVWGIGFKLQ